MRNVKVSLVSIVQKKNISWNIWVILNLQYSTNKIHNMVP